MSGDLHPGIALGVNIDHVATLRQARRARYPDPIHAALLAEEAGADSITLHLREDRRHIQDRDVTLMREALQTRMNLEMAVTEEMVRIALKVLPQDCCLVPESRQEVTTEGGLDVLGQGARIADAVKALGGAGIRVSLFIDPDPAQIAAGRRSGDRIAYRCICRFDGRGARAGIRATVRLCQVRGPARADRECRPRPQLPQRRTHRGHCGNRRTQHRPRDHCALDRRWSGEGRTRHERDDARGTRLSARHE